MKTTPIMSRHDTQLIDQIGTVDHIQQPMNYLYNQ